VDKGLVRLVPIIELNMSSRIMPSPGIYKGVTEAFFFLREAALLLVCRLPYTGLVSVVI